MLHRRMYRQCPTGTEPYVISLGDTLYLIARRFNTSVQAILQANPGIVPQSLRVGQTICVPGAPPQGAVCPSGTSAYMVKSGDTLLAIAGRFNTTVPAILEANPGLIPENLRIGQTICVPGIQPEKPVCPIGTSAYIIKSGDTLSAIARRFNTTVSAILEANPNINPERLEIGQQICVAQEITQEPSCPTANYYVISSGDTLNGISRLFEVPLTELLSVNPGVNPYSLFIGQVLCIPRAPSPVSIVISINAKTLSLYRGGRFVKSYPVATGKPSTPTPKGNFTIVNKQIDPGGPFGTRWMGLSKPSYGIHGTNNPASIGTAASNGCVRMYNSDVNELFNSVPVGSVVRIF